MFFLEKENVFTFQVGQVHSIFSLVHHIYEYVMKCDCIISLGDQRYHKMQPVICLLCFIHFVLPIDFYLVLYLLDIKGLTEVSALVL